MNWQKYQRTLAREFKRSPGKTCVLLALLPVAGYFIAPSLTNRGSAAKPPATVAAPDAAHTPGVAQTVAAPPVAPPTIAWQDLVNWMAGDMRMRPAPTRGLRNPFQLAPSAADSRPEQAEQPDDEGQVAANAPPPPEPGPEEFGFRLTATIVGPRIRMATINGKPYREKSAIFVGLDGDADQALDTNADKPAFTLQAVNRKYVVLERNGRLYQLDLAR